MSSSGKSTLHLGLNQWLPNDKPERADFDSDNLKIDAAFSSIKKVEASNINGNIKINNVETCVYNDTVHVVSVEWITPALQNGWANPTYIRDELHYYKMKDGTLHICGAILPSQPVDLVESGSGATYQVLFTLPAGCRPRNRNLRIPTAVTYQGQRPTIVIQGDTGNVSITGYKYTSGWECVYIPPISFITEG